MGPAQAHLHLFRIWAVIYAGFLGISPRWKISSRRLLSRLTMPSAMPGGDDILDLVDLDSGSRRDSLIDEHNPEGWNQGTVWRWEPAARHNGF